MNPKPDAKPRREAHLQIWFHRANRSMNALIAVAPPRTAPTLVRQYVSDRFHLLDDLVGGANHFRLVIRIYAGTGGLTAPARMANS
jgi:hypothetical protein